MPSAAGRALSPGTGCTAAAPGGAPGEPPHARQAPAPASGQATRRSTRTEETARHLIHRHPAGSRAAPRLAPPGVMAEDPVAVAAMCGDAERAFCAARSAASCRISRARMRQAVRWPERIAVLPGCHSGISRLTLLPGSGWPSAARQRRTAGLRWCSAVPACGLVAARPPGRHYWHDIRRFCGSRWGGCARVGRDRVSCRGCRSR